MRANVVPMTPKEDLEKLQLAIMKVVEHRQPIKFTPLVAAVRSRYPVSLEACTAHCEARDDQEGRVIDGRLQALRKAGKVIPTSAGWEKAG